MPTWIAKRAAPAIWKRVPWKMVWAVSLWLFEKGRDRVDENLDEKERSEFLNLIAKSKGRPRPTWRLSAARVVKWGSPKSSPTIRRPPGLRTRLDLPQGGDRVGDLAEHRGEDDRVHRVVLVGERGRVALGRDGRSRGRARRRGRIVWSRNSCWRSKISTVPSGPTHSAMSRV